MRTEVRTEVRACNREQYWMNCLVNREELDGKTDQIDKWDGVLFG